MLSFGHPQDSRSSYHAHGHAHHASMDKWPWHCTSMGWDGSNELDFFFSESAQWLLSSGIGKILDALIAPMGMPIMPPWANNHDVAHPQAKTVQKNLIWSESTQWFLSSSVCKIPEALITHSRSLYCVYGHAHVAPLGKWSWCYTSRGWDSSNSLDLEWIGQWLLSYRPAEDHSIVLPFSFGKGVGQWAQVQFIDALHQN